MIELDKKNYLFASAVFDWTEFGVVQLKVFQDVHLIGIRLY